MTPGQYLYEQLRAHAVEPSPVERHWPVLGQDDRMRYERAADAVAVKVLAFAAAEREKAIREFGLRVLAHEVAASEK